NAKVVNLASNLAAVIVFAARGSIAWAIALPMGVATIAGASVGARLALRRGDRFVRAVILVVVSAAVVKVAFDLRR
ncbi:MAG TPA: TSUP family transporter, partial [Polyangia bacterium]|nr:TSUP family transporter [Polyangia bacterium]